MVLFIAILYFVLLSWLATKNFKTAVGLLICALPSYFIRFNIGPLPTSALEITFGSIFLVWLIKYGRNDLVELENFYREQRFLCWAIKAFFIFSILGIFISSHHVQALGIWRAYFLEPILFFILLIGRRRNIGSQDLIWFLSLSTVSISVLAIMQKLTGQFFSPTLRPQDLADLHGRVTSFFTSPNAIGLYIAPIVPLMVYGLKDEKRKKFYWAIIFLALIAIVLSFSEGAWVALAVGALLALCLNRKRKMVVGILVVGLIVAVLVAPLRKNLMFQNQSGHNRLVLWNYTWNYLTKTPKNFIFGAGIKDWFDKVQKPVNDFTKIEPLLFPHNTFLNFWSEIGLFGMILFVLVYVFALKESIKKYYGNKILGGAVLCMLAVFMVHGMVDVPYFKNDLSFLWWTLVAIIFI
ncbi:MAG: O-antigen ligase family protein [Candidatus Magasanikbacteria bacterium]|nr:O-antigen ligase family protein [Candidatus Magasanikbacteria bacterium]